MTDIHKGSEPMGPRSVAARADSLPDQGSAVSWAAIFAGAAGAAALSMILLILGAGLGLTAISPWSSEGIGVATFGFAAIAWLSFTQLAASGMGGYLAGRLRSKWTAVHTDEVYFRDTAHGFLAWAVATLLTAVIATSAMGIMVGATASAVGSAASGAAGASATMVSGGDSDEGGNTLDYYVDSLFRSEGSLRQQTGEEAGNQAVEVTRIFAQALRSGTLQEEDERYVARLIAQQTELSQREAQQRVADGFENLQGTLDEMESTTREAADEARKASAYVALWMFIALLIGAFTASLMAVFGGRQRDI